MKPTFHKDAISELVEACAYYQSIDAALGKDFKAAIKEAVEDIHRQPLRYRVVFGDMRRCRLRRFPYSFYFRIVGKAIRVTILKHDRRHPKYGMDRQ